MGKSQLWVLLWQPGTSTQDSIIYRTAKYFIQWENENPPKAFRMQESKTHLFYQHRHLVIELLGTF